MEFYFYSNSATGFISKGEWDIKTLPKLIIFLLLVLTLSGSLGVVAADENPSINLDSSGTVTDWLENPLYSGKVSAYDETGLVDQTDILVGIYSLELPTGNYTLTAESDSYISQSHEIDLNEPLVVDFKYMIHKHSIYGVVYGGDGQALKDIQVDAQDTEGYSRGFATTNEEGRYLLLLYDYFAPDGPEPPLEGTFNLYFTSDFYEAFLVKDIYLTQETAQQVDIILQPYTSLEGSITGEHTGVVEGAQLILRLDDGDTSQDLITYSDNKGYYLFVLDEEWMNNAAAELIVHKYGYHNLQKNVNLVPNEKSIEDLVMVEDALLMVRVYDTSQDPVSEAIVNVQTAISNQFRMVDVLGWAYFALEEGDLLVKVNHTGYGYYENDGHISSDENQEYYIYLIRYGLPVTMQGYITNALTGEPLANTYIYFWPDTHPSYTSIYTRTDSNGFYQLTTTKFPEFVSGLTGKFEIDPFQHEKKTIHLQVGEGPLINHDLALMPYSGSITVQVTDIYNQPISGVNVNLWGEDNHPDKVTDDSGQVVFERCMPSLWWEVFVWDNAYRYYYWDGYYYPLEDGEHIAVNVTLVSTTIPDTIQGKVLDSGGVPLYNVTVELRMINEGNWDEFAWAKKYTDGAGLFKVDLYGYTANIMRLIFSKPGYLNHTVDILPPELPVNRTFTMEEDLGLTGQISGYITNFLEQTLAGVTVVASKSGSSNSITTTDNNGYYEFKLPAGSYLFTTYATGLISQSKGTTVALEQNLIIDFTLYNSNSLYGYVYDRSYDGIKSISSAWVKVYQQGSLINSTFTDSEGGYQTISLPDGYYEFQVGADLFEEYILEDYAIIGGQANYMDFFLSPGPHSTIYGQVRDAITFWPLENVNVTLIWWENEEEYYQISTGSDVNGNYLFESLYPGGYALSFNKSGYAPANNIWKYISIGEELEHNQTLEPLESTIISGTVMCWSGPLDGAEVTLDGLYTIFTNQEGYFEFRDIIPGWHHVKALWDGSMNSWSFDLGNGEHKNGSIYLYSHLIEYLPPANQLYNQLDSVKARIWAGKEGATGATITLNYYTKNFWGLPVLTPLAGELSWENDWLIFTPTGGNFTTQGLHIARIILPGEINMSWEFYIYPITSKAPSIGTISPADGTFFRNPAEINLSAAVQNDPGNGLSATNSILLFNGAHLVTTVTGNQLQGTWTLSATSNIFFHGLNTLHAIAVDNQGLTTQKTWEIFISLNDPSSEDPSLQGPYISNLVVTPIFSPHTGKMNVTALISEPIKNARLTINGYSNVISHNLGNFDNKITASWSGIVHRSMGLPSFIPPDGPISFTITGTATDGTLFNVVYGESFIDSNPPQIIIDPVEAVNSIDFTITGSVIDIGGLQTFNSTISSGSAVDFVVGYDFSSNYQVNADGKYTIVFYAEDVVGNKANKTIPVIVDQVKPTITFLSPQEEVTVRPGQPITFALADANSGLNNDYTRKNWSWYNLVPKYIQVTLDGIDITSKLNYSNFNYRDKVTINNNFGTFEMGTLSSVTATFNPKLHGFLREGNHQLIVNLKDRAGNEIEKVLSFNSINPPPYIEEKNLDMITGTGYQTLIYELEIQENSDRGFDRFELLWDGEMINDSPVFIPDPVLPYKGLLKYTITRNFEQGPHTLDLTVYDGMGQSTSFLNGFYHDPRILVPLNFTWSTDYVYDNQLYIGNHQHQAQINTNYYFKPGSSSIYGYSKIIPPSSVFHDPKLPMGFQRAYTLVQLNPADAKQNTHLSFWMTNILDKHICGWGWGDTISIFFTDGYQTLPAINLEKAPGIVYHHHQAPHVTKNGFVDSYLSTARGADGRIWKNYAVEIPEGLDKSSISVIIEWQAKNWNSWGNEMYNEISSLVTHFEFFTPLVVDISPTNLANDVPLNAKIKARFRLPLDETGIIDKFYLTDVTGIKIASSIQLNGNQIVLSPDKKLNSNNKYRVLVSPDIKTIYGRILPKPTAYSWEFNTLPGETSPWQTIRYNGEEYQVYLIWGEGYNGGNPNYISPGLMKTYYGASLVGVDVVKKVGDVYYNVPDMNTKKLIVQAAQRKAYYELINPDYFARLINQRQIDYVYNGAHAPSGLFLYIFDHVPGVDLSEIPDDEDVIIDVILMALGDGSNPYEMPAALTSGLNYFSTALSGCQKINQAVEKMREMKASKIGQPFEASVIGDVLEIAELVQGELDFQKSLWEYMYKAMWSIEVANQYRSQLSTILPHTSGDTRTALSQLLSRDVNQVKRTIIQKCAVHVVDQSVEAIKQVLVEAASSNPYVKIALKTTQIFFKIAGFTRWDDVRADSFIALAQQDAEDNFFKSWKHLTYNLQLIPDNQITPYDLSLISTSSKVRYSAAGDFYDTMVTIGNIVKYWDAVLSLDSGKINSWNNIIFTWSTTAGNYHNNALNLIPEISSSNADTAQLLSLIRSSTYNKATYAQIGVYSPVTILLTTPDNRKIGYDHLNNVNINDFDPEGSYNGPYIEPQFITIPLNIGYYTIDLFGTGNGPYHITLETLDEWGEVISGSQWSGNAYPGMNTRIQFILDEYGSVVHYDDTVPIITVQGLINGGTYSGYVNPSIQVHDDNLESYTQILDGKLYSGGKITTLGQHVLIIRATDGVNVVYEIINFFIETSFLPEPGTDDKFYDRIIPVKLSYTTTKVSGKIVTIPQIVSDSMDNTSPEPQEPASSTGDFNDYLLILTLIIIIAASGALILYKNK